MNGDATAFMTFNDLNTTLQVSSGATTSILYNDFENGLFKGVGGSVGHPIDATKNWWGTTDPAAIAGKITGEVDFTPFLLMPPHAADLEAVSLRAVAGILRGGEAITLEYVIANNSPIQDGAGVIETRTFFYLNVDDQVTFSKPLALVNTPPILAPIPGEQNIFKAQISVQLPDEGDPAWSLGLFGFYTISMRVDAMAEVVEWSESNNTRSIRVPVVPLAPNPLAGDYNYNGVVDAADYTMWRDALGSTIYIAADGDGNGTVEPADYGVWKQNFGNTLPPPAAGVGSGSAAAAAVVDEAVTQLAPSDDVVARFPDRAPAVARSPDRATVRTVGLLSDGILETFTPAQVRGPETRAQQSETRAQQQETRVQQFRLRSPELLGTVPRRSLARVAVVGR